METPHTAGAAPEPVSLPFVLTVCSSGRLRLSAAVYAHCGNVAAWPTGALESHVAADGTIRYLVMCYPPKGVGYWRWCATTRRPAQWRRHAYDSAEQLEAAKASGLPAEARGHFEEQLDDVLIRDAWPACFDTRTRSGAPTSKTARARAPRGGGERERARVSVRSRY